MNPIRKAILFYKKEGFRNTLIRISEKIWEIVLHFPGIIKEKFFLSQYIHQIEEKTAEKNRSFWEFLPRFLLWFHVGFFF